MFYTGEVLLQDDERTGFVKRCYSDNAGRRYEVKWYNSGETANYNDSLIHDVMRREVNFQIDDIVLVVATGGSYTTYDDFFDENDLMIYYEDYVNGKQIETGEYYLVVNVGFHEHGNKIYVLRSQCGEIFLYTADQRNSLILIDGAFFDDSSVCPDDIEFNRSNNSVQSVRQTDAYRPEPHPIPFSSTVSDKEGAQSNGISGYEFDMADKTKYPVLKPKTVKVPKQGSFKQIYIDGKRVKTPHSKIKNFYKMFRRPIHLINNGGIDGVTMLDDLTLQLDFKLNDEQIIESKKHLANEFYCETGFFNGVIVSKAIDDVMLSVADIESVMENLFMYLRFSPAKMAVTDVKLDDYFNIIQRIKGIRKQPVKVFRFFNRNVLKIFNNISSNGNLKEVFESVTGNDIDIFINTLKNDLNGLTALKNECATKKTKQYFITFDAERITQCSYNTSNWRSCFNMLDGESRFASYFSAQNKQIGMIYSLTSDGKIRNRRLFTIVDGGFHLGRWYPNKPSGDTNAINSILKEILGYGDTISERGSINTGEFPIGGDNMYPDFMYSEGYTITTSDKAYTDLENVYRVKQKTNPLFNFVNVCHSFNWEIDGEKIKIVGYKD